MDRGRDDSEDRAFAAQLEQQRRRLQLHCYRMVGSLEDSEDLAQETVVRAWRNRESFQRRSALSTWLHRIATNACLDFLAKRPARPLPALYSAALEPGTTPPDPSELMWLDPYPERMLEGLVAEDADPETATTAKETIEIAFLAAIQHLPPRRRAVLLVRDVLGWSAKDTAAALEMTVPAVNTALRRARATLRQHLPRRRVDWSAAGDRSDAERALLRQYIDAHERGDVDALARLLREDVRFSAPPLPQPPEGPDGFVASVKRSATPGRFRYVPTRANGQIAAASYVRREGDASYRPLAIDVLRVEDGALAEVTVFLRPELFPAFGLPATL